MNTDKDANAIQKKANKKGETRLIKVNIEKEIATLMAP
jgi:hypothetical protein